MSPSRYGNFGNFWDYRDECKKNLQVYIDEFDKPQLRELLTQYGPIGVIWFDTPSLIRPDQAQELVQLVKSLQPDCLVNSRVGDFVDFDYHSLGDAEVPDYGTGVDWETPMTICHAWGYNNQPNNRYRDVNELIHQLVDIVSLGGNYLLNVGPDARGVIPQEAQVRLRAIGEWMKVNAESIHRTTASPFSVRPSWGRITAASDALYLHVYRWSDQITLTGIKGSVTAIGLLADPGRAVTWTQTPCGSLGYDRLTIHLPSEAPDANASVVKVQFGGPVHVETRIIEDDEGSIELAACRATVHCSAGKPSAGVSVSGIVRDWLSTDDWFSWEFLCTKPGTFSATVTIRTGFHGNWDFGHEVQIACGDQENRLMIEDTGIPTAGFQKRTYQAGTFRIASEGLRRVSIRASRLSRANGQGFQMSSVNLHPHRG